MRTSRVSCLSCTRSELKNYLGVRDPNTVDKDANGIANGYVDNDVYEAARAFMGWRVDDDITRMKMALKKRAGSCITNPGMTASTS